MTRTFIAALAIATHLAGGDVFASQPVVLEAMTSEMQRTIEGLRGKADQPPYFLSYSVSEVHTYSASASFGNIVGDGFDKSRVLDIDVRVGDYKLDNTHQIRGNAFESAGGSRGSNLPVGDDLGALRTAIWSATDKAYKEAAERYVKVLTNMAVKVAEEDTAADFSQEKPHIYEEQLQTLSIDTAYWKGILRDVSAVFAAEPTLYGGQAYLKAEVLNKYFVNSEGSKVTTSEAYVQLFVQASTKADDGMTLPLYRSYFAHTAQRLPSKDKLLADARELVRLLASLRTAPLAETFSGPAILSGEASGVFFHEIFGHRIEGHRQKESNSSQTFKNLVGKPILPPFIDVVFDPTIRNIGGTDVVGAFKYDDQGIPAQVVTTVEGGIFKSFLMSRSPIESFPSSNGHGRRQPGYPVVSRQSNLRVIARNQVPFDTLRARLRAECVRQNKEYGLYFVEISGGFTFTDRTIPNAFNVQPLLVYKIYADGRPDEVVRGVDLIGTPLATFEQIIAAGNDLGIFNGVCGAESGGVPVSASSPSLLVRTIETQKKAKSQARPPLLPSPVSPGGTQ